MLRKEIVFVLIAFGLCGGCSERRQDTTSLAIIELVYTDRNAIVCLPNDYGFLIQWIDGHEPEFYLYNKPSHTIQMTGDFQTFLVGLQALPDGAKVDRIRGCAITEGGMPPEYSRRLRETIAAKRFHETDVDDGNFPVCSCETLKMRRYKSADERATLKGLTSVDYSRRQEY